MINGRLRSRCLVYASLVFVVGFVLAMTSCLSNESKAKRAIEEFYANQGAKDITIDLFYTDAKFPDKAYASATVVYNFASSSGKPQRELSGFILTREGDGWRVERNTIHTKEQQKAALYIAGGK